MKFILHVKHRGEPDESAWTETYNKVVEPVTQEGVEKWAAETLAKFNSTLHPKELPREVVSVEVVSFSNDDVTVPHEWAKTNLVTLRGGYDTAECEACGATARRYGIGAFVMDAKFERKKGFHPYVCKPRKASK